MKCSLGIHNTRTAYKADDFCDQITQIVSAFSAYKGGFYVNFWHVGDILPTVKWCRNIIRVENGQILAVFPRQTGRPVRREKESVWQNRQEPGSERYGSDSAAVSWQHEKWKYDERSAAVCMCHTGNNFCESKRGPFCERGWTKR